MRKILISLLFSILFIVGGILFVHKNFSTTEIFERPFIVTKGYGKNLYNFEMTFKKGTEVKYIINRLKLVNIKPEKIYIRAKKGWQVVGENQKIFRDSTFKIGL